MPSKTVLKKEIKKIIIHHLAPQEPEIFIFGSQANRKQFKPADIDIGIKTKRAIHWKKFAKIKSELEEIQTLHPIDLVDFSTTDENFKKIALANIEKL